MKKTIILQAAICSLQFAFPPLGSGLLLSQNTRLWATYYGGTGIDGGDGIATDASGNVYIAGGTTSTSSIASGGFQNTYGGGLLDAFLVKFSSSGSRIWATYYGGTEDDEGLNVVADAVGNIYLAGITSSNSNIASGGFQNVYGGGTYDAFLVKFDTSGNRLWATYYGGTGIDGGSGIATDASGNVYLAGNTNSASGIASGGFQNVYGGGTFDAFLVKFDAAGNRLWATYYGGAVWDGGYGVAGDAAGNVFLAGPTNSPAGIASGGFQNVFGGDEDAFLVKFDAAGNRLWATYYGGAVWDGGYGVAGDAAGNVFLAGPTNSPAGIASGGFQNVFGGDEDAFLVKFDSLGTRLWASYYGGTDREEVAYDGLSVDGSGNVYLAGDTYSPNAIAFGGFQNNLVGGSENLFLVKFSASGLRLCATYYGQTHEEFGCVAADVAGNVYLGGGTFGTSGISSGGFQNTCGGGLDACLVKFSSCFSTLGLFASSTNVLCNGQCMGTATASPANGTAPYTYLWSSSGQTTATVTGLCAGSYTVTVTDAVPTTVTATVTITQPPTALSSSVTATNASCNIQCNGSSVITTGGGTPGYTYSWNTMPVQTTANATGLCANNYTCSITDANGCTSTQTVTITEPAPLTANQSASICSDSSYTLPGGTVVSIAGTYTSTLTSVNGCDSIITTNLTVYPVFAINQSASICSGSSYTLPGGIVVSIAGTYTSTHTSINGCDSIITTNLTVNPSPTATAFSSVTITQGQSVTLTASGGGTYSWSNGANGTPIVVTPAVTTVYCVTVTNANNCTDTACVTLTVEPLDCSGTGEFYLPNAFSPNGDGENDVLQIYYGNSNCIKTFILVIYDRWGERVFKTTDPAFTWNGMYKDKLSRVLRTAVFVYYMEATLFSGEEIIKKGNISLIR